MISKFIVKGLHNRLDVELDLHQDLNILTGRNGSGKTSALKLMWYMISGNLERIFREMLFNYAEIQTKEYSLSIECELAFSNQPSRAVLWKFKSKKLGRTVQYRTRIEQNEDSRAIELLNFEIAVNHNLGSIFFPTFRRIEGGFSIEHLDSDKASLAPPLNDAMSTLAARLSWGKHQFVSSIATRDISELITERYATISKRVNDLHGELFQEIITSIGAHEKGRSEDKLSAKKIKSELLEASTLLEHIRTSVKKHSEKQEKHLHAFTVLHKTVQNILQYKGVQVSKDIILGEKAEAIDSSKLSAGEKQMLSFLAYNALSSNCAIFIDEPETSLHTDWQRILFSILLDQGKTNQFIATTHSPFIYTKYEDKEHILGSKGEAA